MMNEPTLTASAASWQFLSVPPIQACCELPPEDILAREGNVGLTNLHMPRAKAPIRNRVDFWLLLSAPAVGLALDMSGVPLMSLEQSHTYSSADSTVTSSVYKMRWPLLIPFATGCLGVLLLATSRRGKPEV
jgi:hypothetical protein